MPKRGMSIVQTGSQAKVTKWVRQADRVTGPYDGPAMAKPAQPLVVTGPDADVYLPPIGTVRGVCTDWTYLGWRQGKYGWKEELEVTWELEARHPAGHRFAVSRRYTRSLAERASLRQMLERWQGFPFSADELKAGVMLESRYLRRAAKLVLERGTGKSGSRFTRVVDVLPLRDEATVVPEGLYVRRRDRRGYVAPSTEKPTEEGSGPDE